jgi:hypothetical protein
VIVQPSVSVKTGDNSATFPVNTKSSSTAVIGTVRAIYAGVSKVAAFYVGPSAPYISSITTAGVTLSIHGWFGIAGTTATVNVGGTNVPAVIVDPLLVTCTLPAKAAGQTAIYVNLSNSTRSFRSATVQYPIFTGRWDSVLTSGAAVGDIGMLITSQTATDATGTFIGSATSFAVSGSGISYQASTENGPVTVDLTYGAGGLKGNITVNGKPVALDFIRESDVPVDTYAAPQVVSKNVSIVWNQALSEFVLSIPWSVPVGGSWDFTIVQGSKTIEADTAADQANFGYNPKTNTYMMPIYFSEGLEPGTCEVTLPAAGWNDPYGKHPSNDWTGTVAIANPFTAGLFPLAPGFAWTYDIQGAGSVTFTAGAPVLFHGSVALPITDGQGDAWYYGGTDPITLLGENHQDQQAPNWDNPARILLPAVQTAGSTWTQSFQLTFYTSDGTAETPEDLKLTGKVVGIETVKVPAGVFKNALHVTTQFTQTNGSVQQTDDRWYVPGVGMVQWIETASGSATVNLQLKSYKLGW